MDEKKTGTPEEKILATARERYKRGIEADDANRKSALEAVKFRNLEQWDPEVKKARETDPEGARPCPVVDKTGQFLRQVVNDEKQNRPSIKIRPVDDKGDPEVAEVLQGIVRHIEDISGADLAYDTAYEQAVDGGYGYFRVLTEYCDSKSFDQEIKIKRIRNRFQVVLDDARQEPDGSDAKWGFIVDKMHRDEFKASFPKADPCDFEASHSFGDWVEKDYVLVAEYFHFEEKDATICLWKSGAVSVKGEPAPQTDYLGDAIIQERQTKLRQLKWKKISAKEVLEERDLPGELIPIVEVIGEEIDEEGNSHKNGLLKRAMEPQRIHNYASANFIENVGLAPRSQWVAEHRQIEGFENLYKTANRRNISVLPYKAVVEDGAVIPPPQRAQPAGIAVGWQAVLQNSEHDISSSMGMYAETTLGVGDANSGKQEALQQKRGDTATFHFMDNLARSVRYAGKIILGWIPTYYDTERVARILGEDGSPRMVKLNPNQAEAVLEQPGEGGAVEKIYNITVGKYDVTVQTGPGFMTKRQEAADFLTNAMTAAKDPVTANILTYLSIKNTDWAGAEEAEKMLRKTLPPGIAEPEDGEQEVPMVPTPQGPLPVNQAAQLIAQLMQQVEMAGEQLKKAGDLKEIENQVATKASDVSAAEASLAAREEALKLREQLAHKSLEAEHAKDEAERTKIVADMRMLVNDAVARLEAMKAQAEEAKAGEQAELDEQKAAQQAEERAAKEADRQAKNDAISGQQAQLMESLQQAIALLAAPRRKTPVRNEAGDIVEVLEEPVGSAG